MATLNDDIPGDVSDLPTDTRPLLIDMYLSRSDIIQRIDDTVDVIDADPSTGYITHRNLCRLLADRVGDERRPNLIAHKDNKGAVIRRLADHYGFGAGEDQRSLVKSQLIHLLIVEATDSTPDEFTVPADPDTVPEYSGSRNHGDNTATGRTEPRR